MRPEAVVFCTLLISYRAPSSCIVLYSSYQLSCVQQLYCSVLFLSAIVRTAVIVFRTLVVDTQAIHFNIASTNYYWVAVCAVYINNHLEKIFLKKTVTSNEINKGILLPPITNLLFYVTTHDSWDAPPITSEGRPSRRNCWRASVALSCHDQSCRELGQGNTRQVAGTEGQIPSLRMV